MRDSNPKVQLPPVYRKVTKMLNLALIQILHPVVMHLHWRPNIPRSVQLETKSAASSSKLKSNKDVESSSDLDFSSSNCALSRSTERNKKSSNRTDFIYHKAFTAHWEFENWLDSQYAEIVGQKNEILLNSWCISQRPIDRMNREVASRSKNKTNSPPCLEESLGDDIFSTQLHYYQPTFSNGVNFCTISQSDYLTLPSDISIQATKGVRAYPWILIKYLSVSVCVCYPAKNIGGVFFCHGS